MRHDPRALRAEFPIFAAQPAPFRYLDNAATGQICRAAADALWRYETTQRANVKRGVYRLADAATNAFQHAREEVAAYVGAREADEIVFTVGDHARHQRRRPFAGGPPPARRRDPARPSWSTTPTSCRGRSRPSGSGR